MPDEDNPYLPPRMYDLSHHELVSMLRQYEEIIAALGQKESPDALRVRRQLKEAIAAIIRELDQGRVVLPLTARLAQARRRCKGEETRRHTETLVFRAESEEGAVQDRRVQRRLQHGWELLRVCEVTMPEFDLLPSSRLDPVKRKYLVKMEIEA